MTDQDRIFLDKINEFAEKELGDIDPRKFDTSNRRKPVMALFF